MIKEKYIDFLNQQVRNLALFSPCQVAVYSSALVVCSPAHEVTVTGYGEIVLFPFKIGDSSLTINFEFSSP